MSSFNVFLLFLTVDWSPDGQFLCYVTNDIHLCTCKSDLSEHSTSRLPGKMFGEALTGGPEAYGMCRAYKICYF